MAAIADSSATSPVSATYAPVATIDTAIGLASSSVATWVAGTSTTRQSSPSSSIDCSNNEEFSTTTAPGTSRSRSGSQYRGWRASADQAWETIGGACTGPSPTTTVASELP